MEERVAGIDFGTTNSSCGVVKTDGKAEIHTFNESESRQPSWYYNDGSTELRGNSAKEKANTDIELCMYDSKRFIGKTYNEVKDDVERYVNVANENGKIVYRIKDKTFTPGFVYEKLLKFLKKNLDSFNGWDLTRAVIGIPAKFNKSQREATMKAALFNTSKTDPDDKETLYDRVKLIKEPVAAAYSYIYETSEKKMYIPNKSKILVYDFGGGTFDLALIEYDNGYLNVLSTDGDPELGGQDVTNAIVEEFAKKFKIDLKSEDIKMKKKKGRLTKACEETKKMFVVNDDKEEFEIDYNDGAEISYALFCKLANPSVDKTIKITKEFLKKNGVNTNEIFKVIATGGSSKMRNVKPKLDAVFTEDKVHISSRPCDDVVSGITLYGYKFMQKETLAPIGIRATRDKKRCFVEIIPVGTKWGETITISGVNDNKAPDALFRFYEYDISEENFLGKLILPFNDKDKNKKINSILVTLKVKINENGDLQATASYEDGGEATTIIHLFKTREDFE